MTLLDHPLVDIDELEKLAGKAGPIKPSRANALPMMDGVDIGGEIYVLESEVRKVIEAAMKNGRAFDSDNAELIKLWLALDPQTLLALTKVVRVGYLAENALANLLENPQFTVAVGGNPLVVDGMLANARIALERLRDSLKAVRAGV